VKTGLAPKVARASADGKTVVVANGGDNTVSVIDAKLLRVRATLAVCRQPGDVEILPDSSKAFVACAGSSQVASIALAKDDAGPAAEDRVLALIDVGKTPVSLELKPDGGELAVCDFDSDSISFIETGNDEVGSSVLMGEHPARSLVTRDNSRLYASNFGSDSVAVYDIDAGKRVATFAVGSRPEGLALSQDERYLLVLDTQAGDVTVVQRRTPRKKLEPSEYSLLTMIPVGVQPNGIVVKAFVVGGGGKKK
jgi:YVTN family beta-propeller protein